MNQLTSKNRCLTGKVAVLFVGLVVALVACGGEDPEDLLDYQSGGKAEQKNAWDEKFEADQITAAMRDCQDWNLTFKYRVMEAQAFCTEEREDCVFVPQSLLCTERAEVKIPENLHAILADGLITWWNKKHWLDGQDCTQRTTKVYTEVCANNNDGIYWPDWM